MIISLRKTLFARMMIWLMLLSVTLVSCDPNGDYAKSNLIDQEIEKQMAEMESLYTSQQCADARVKMDKAKNYVLAKSKLGMVSRADVLNFLIDEEIADGNLRDLTQKDRQDFVDAFSKDAFFLNNGESLDQVYGYLKYDNRITQAEMDFLVGFEDRLENLRTEADVVDVFTEVRRALPADRSLTSNFKQALTIGMDNAELAMCADMIQPETRVTADQSPEAQSRCTIEVCVTEYRWVIQIITVVIAVVAILLAIFTFGFSLLLVSVTFAAWVLVPVIVCSFLPCPDTDCPPGQSLTCHPLFTLNSDGLCFASGFSIIGGGIYSQPTNGTDCPPGTIFTGTTTGCFHEILNAGAFSGLVDGEDFFTDASGAFHTPICQ